MSMANKVEFVIRARDFEIAPDVELYVEKMSKNGTFEKLSQENNLNAETIRNTSLGKMCNIFVEESGKLLEAGDIIIFGDTATFEIFTDGSD